MRDIIGHRKVLNRFMVSKSKNALAHAHLIVGEDGIGKSLLAKGLAEVILGVEPRDNYVDIINYKTSENTFKIANVRELISEVNKKPYEGDKKVIILYDGQKMTTEAQNALLKTIEEPPSGVYIIILTTSLELLLDTIKSRCQISKLSPLSGDDILEFINRDYKHIDEEGKASLIAFSQGIPGRIEKFTSDKGFGILRDFVLDILLSVAKRSEKDAIKYTGYFETKSKAEISKVLVGRNNDLLEQIVLFTRDIIIYKEIANAKLIINSDKLERIAEIANLMPYKKLKEFTRIIDETREKLVSNTNRSLTFNEMMRKMLEA
ncbi:DNA polymerase III subunit delta' [uncultured Clostridium sp.]|uniref:DNA polymerase III subunit delta' n=1 Tax=uncultured Clostridium sp. TaxID=59620 RepID=UPI0026200A75|nr:DNA polymerase III subunit delta' [uncultured Clostridium sp.]